MNKQKGFTIIELIVVIAIIAVLAGIVLVNVIGYINKGKDASIKGNMETIRINASVYLDGTGANKYMGFDDDQLYKGPSAAIASVGTAPISNIEDYAYCVKTIMYDTTNYPNGYCVDSTGYSGAMASGACSASTYNCQ